MEIEVGTGERRPGAIRAYVGTFAHLSPNARRLLLATVCVYTSLGVFGVLFNLYLVALHRSLAYVGLVAAVTTVGQAAISPLMAWTLRYTGARAALTAGAALQLVTLLLSAIVTNGAGLAISAGLSGAALTVITVPIYPYMMEHSTAKERSHLFSAYFAASQVGTLLGSLLSGTLPSLMAALPLGHARGHVVEYRLALLIGAAITAIGVWQFWSLRDDEQVADSGEHAAAVAEDDGEHDALRRDVVVMLAATSLIALVLGATLPFFNVYFAQRLHAGTAEIGTIYAASGVVCTAAAFLAPVAGRRGRLEGFSVTRALTGPIFVLFWLHPGLLLAAAAYTGRNVLATISGALENTFAMEVMPARLRATVASWRSFTFYAAWSLGSLIAGVVVSRFGYDALFVTAGALTAVGSTVYFARFARK